MKHRPWIRLLSMVLAILMALPASAMLVSAGSETDTDTEGLLWDFEDYEVGTTISSDAPPFNKILEKNGNKFIRIPVVCSDTSEPKTKPTNRAGTLNLKNAAFSTTELTSIKVDLWRNPVDRTVNVGNSTAPNVGIWIWAFGYTNANGEVKSENFFRLGDVDIATGEFNFKDVKGTKTGAAGLAAGQWNAIEFLFDPADGSFDIYVNNVLYAENCFTTRATGTNFTVAANQLYVAVCSGNAPDGYTDDDVAGTNYENAFSLDVDNVRVKTVARPAADDGADEEEGVLLGAHDFESLTVGSSYTATNTSLAPGYSQIVQVGDTKALRLPIVCSDTSSPGTAPTNRGRLFQMKHDAFPTTGDVSISVDVYMHAAVGTNPNVGLWLRKVGHSGGSTHEWYHLVDINLTNGEALFTLAKGEKVAGATPLKQNQWNNVKILFHTKDGSFDVYFNDALYAECDGYVAGSNFTVAANMLMLAVDSANANTAFTSAANAGSAFENANYMDFDNLTLTALPAKAEDGEEEEEDQTVTETPMSAPAIGGLDLYGFETGKTLTTEDGFATVAPINQVAVRDGRRVLRLPLAVSDLNNLKTTPTNHGYYFCIPHAAFPAGAKTSIKVDLYMHGVKGTNPTVGIWLLAVDYTDTNGVNTSKQWVRLADFNLLTGEATMNSVSGTKTNARGLVKDAWNTVEFVFRSADGSFDIYVNDALYAKCKAPVEGTNFTVKANRVIYAVDSGNVKDSYTAKADLTANYSNANYMDADNFRIEPTTGIKAEDPVPLPEGVHYDEDFEAYAEGELPMTVVGSSPPQDSGRIAVDEDGNFWKIPFSGTGTSKGEFNINKNSIVPHDAMTYRTNPKVIFEASYFIPTDSIGVMHARFSGNTCTFITQDGEEIPARAISWLNLWQIAYNGAGATPVLTGGGSNVGGAVSFPRNEWATVSAAIDLVSGTYDIYLNGMLAIEGIQFCPQYHDGSKWIVGAGLKNLEIKSNSFIVFTANSTCKTSANDTWIGIDNVKIYDAEGIKITVDGEEREAYEGVLYDLATEGKTFLYATVNYADGTTETVTDRYLTAREGMSVTTYQISVRTQKDPMLRVNSPVGIRFLSLVDDADLEKLLYADGVEKVEIGTLITLQSELNLAGGKFTKLDLDRYLDVPGTLNSWYEGITVEGQNVFAGSVVEIKETNYNEFFCGRGYIRVTLADETVITVYASNTTPATSTYAILAKNAIETGAELGNFADHFASVAEKFEMTETEKQAFDLKGLNVLSIGDSLFGGHDLPAGAQWLELLAVQCEWNLTNLGVNGWTVAKNDAAYADPSKVRTSMYDKLMNDSGYRFGATSSTYYTYGDVYNKTAADVDLIFLEGGWNDFGWGIPLGDVNSNDGSTYMGAIRTMVAKLLEVYPNAKVVLITSWHTYDTRTKDNACRIDFVANGMKNVYAAHYADNERVGLIDAGNPILTETHMHDATWKATYAIDSAHLNAEGMKVMAESMLPLIWDMMEGYDADGTAADPAACEHAHVTRAGCVTNGRCTACLTVVEEAHGHKWKSGICTVCGRRDLLDSGNDKTRVVCVGDSITAGGYWKNNLCGYLPIEDYEVIGLGVSGTTALWTGVDLGFDPTGAPYSYVSKPQYDQSKRYNGDVVVIMLGTNDTKAVNYAKIKEDNGAQFIKDMTAMVKAYQAQGNAPQVFLALPATIYPASKSMSNANLEELIIPCLETVAAQTGAILIDVHGATKNQSESFPDGVHPNDAGKAVIAQTIATAIKENAED